MRETADAGDERKSLVVRLMPLFLIVTATVAIWLSGLLDYVSLQQLAENREALHGYVADNLALALLAFTGIYATVVTLSLPIAAALTLTGGFLFGWFPGGLATVIGATLGAVIIFTLARTALADTLARKAGPLLDRFRKGFQEDAISYLLFLRLVPLFPFWVVNLAPALLGVRLRDFVLTTFIGIMPGTFAFALTGAGLDSVLVAQEEAYNQCVTEKSAENCKFDVDPAHLLTKELLIAFAALGIVALIPVIVKRFWKNRPGRA